MDLIIENYIDDHYTTELQAEIRHCCTLFEKFDFHDYQNDLVSLLMDQYNQSPEDIYDKFIILLRAKQDYVLQAFNLILKPESSLFQRNQILFSLNLLQDLENYDAVLNILESDLDPEEQFAEIVAQVSMLRQTDIFPILDHFDPTILKTLKQYIYQKNGMDVATEEMEQKQITQVIEKMKLFRGFLKDQTCLGFKLLEHDMLLLRPIQMYLPFIHDAFTQTNPIILAIDIYSFLIMTKEGFGNPLDAFRQYSYLMLDDVDTVMKVDVQITKLINDFERYRVKQQEQRLPTIQEVS